MPDDANGSNRRRGVIEASARRSWAKAERHRAPADSDGPRLRPAMLRDSRRPRPASLSLRTRATRRPAAEITWEERAACRLPSPAPAQQFGMTAPTVARTRGGSSAAREAEDLCRLLQEQRRRPQLHDSHPWSAPTGLRSQVATTSCRTRERASGPTTERSAETSPATAAARPRTRQPAS